MVDLRCCLNLLAYHPNQVCSKYNYCGDTECNGTLNYAKATGPDDVLHYAWSTTGYPSLFISRSPRNNNANTSGSCLSNFHVINYESFIATQQPGSVSIDGTSTNFSFALIFKSLVEFKVSSKKLQGAEAFDPAIAHNCSVSPKEGCYNVYHLNNTDLIWSSYNPSEGLRAHDSNGSLILHLKVSVFSRGYVYVSLC